MAQSQVKTFTLKADKDRDLLVSWLYEQSLDMPLEVTCKEYERTRSLPQNSRYWATLTELLNSINQTISVIAGDTGYTAIEIKRLIAKELSPEQIAILFARTPEVAHEVLKEICGIPTSTRLGTKEFIAYEERMEQTIAEIAGHIEAFRRMAA
jgi:hypothetical protein